MKFIIYGPPRTKKTHQRLIISKGRYRVLPSKQWTEWLGTGVVETELGRPIVFRGPAISQECNCRAVFYRDANRGDAVGYYQGLADFMEKRGIIENDVLIRSWDGSRLLVDKQNARVEVELTEV